MHTLGHVVTYLPGFVVGYVPVGFHLVRDLDGERPRTGCAGELMRRRLRMPRPEARGRVGPTRAEELRCPRVERCHERVGIYCEIMSHE